MIELYSGLINKKNCVSQIQDKPRFFVIAFGDSKMIYNVERGSSFLDSAKFSKFFHRVSYKVFVLKDRLINSKNKITETGVASEK